MAGIGDSWGTKQELLHPRGPDGRWIEKAGVAEGIIEAVLSFLANFRPRTFQNKNQSTQYLHNISRRQGRKRMTNGDLRRLYDLPNVNEDLQDGVIDNPSTKQFVDMMDRTETELPDDLIVTTVLPTEAFGFSAQTATGTSSDTDPGIRGLSGKLGADRGYLTMAIGNVDDAVPVPAGSVRLIVAAKKGTKVHIPGGSSSDPSLFLTRGQPFRITKIKPDGAGGWHMYATIDEARTPGEVPAPIGGPRGLQRPPTGEREAAIRNLGKISAKREGRPDEVAEQADIEARQAKADANAQETPVPSPAQEAERQRVEALPQQPATGEPPPRTEPAVGRVGEPGAPAPGGTQAPPSTVPEAPAVPSRAVDLRLAVRDAKVPSPSQGPRRKAWNEAYIGVTSGKKDPIDAVRELDADIATLRRGGEIGRLGENRGESDEARGPDTDALQQLRDVIAKEYGLEPSPKDTGSRTEAGLPKVAKPGVQTKLSKREQEAQERNQAAVEAPPAPTPVKKAAKKAAKKATGRTKEERIQAEEAEFRRQMQEELDAEGAGAEHEAQLERAFREQVLPPVAKKAAKKAAVPGDDIDKMTKAQMFAELERRGVETRKSWNKEQLGKLLRGEDAQGLKTGETPFGKAPLLKTGAKGPVQLPEDRTPEQQEQRRREAEQLQRQAEIEEPADLDKMTKAELLAESERRGIVTPKSWSKDKIKAHLRDEGVRTPVKKTPEQRRRAQRTDQELIVEMDRQLARETAGNPDLVRQQLLATEEDDRFRYLEDLLTPLNLTESRRLARGLGIKSAGRSEKPEIIQAIIRHFEGVDASALEGRPDTPFNAGRKAEEVSAVMTGAPGRERVEQGMKAMEGLNMPQLRQVAKELGVGVPGRDRDESKTPEALREFIARNLDSFGSPGTPPTLTPAPVKKAAKAVVPGAAPGTAAGKITAGRIQPGMRVLVSPNGRATDRKTGARTLTVTSVDRIAPDRKRGERNTRIQVTGTDENGNEVKVASVGSATTFMVAPEPGAAPKRMTIGEARRLSAMDAIRENEVTGGESAAWENVSRNVESGDWSVARARKEAKDSARYWRESATTIRRAGTTGTPEGREKAASRLEGVADQYDKLAEDLTISQSVTKTDKYMRPRAPAAVPEGPSGHPGDNGMARALIPEERERQVKLDRVSAYGSVGTLVDELVANGASPRALAHRIRTRGKQQLIPDDDLKDMLEAAEAGDNDRVRKLARGLMDREGITQIGSTDDVVPLDGNNHQSLTRGGLPRDTSVVHVVRPGSRAKVDGDDILIDRAVVEPATPEEVARVTRAKVLVPEGSVSGLRTDSPIDNELRKKELRKAWIGADIQAPPGAGRKSQEEIKGDLLAGRITPEEAIRRFESEIAFTNDDLTEVEAHLREGDLSDAERGKLIRHRDNLVATREAHEAQSEFLRQYFKEEAPVVSIEEAKVQDPVSYEFLKDATPDDMREAAKEAGLDAPSGDTADEMFTDLLKQVARNELARRAAKKAARKAAPAKVAKKAAPEVPRDKERVDARLLAEGLELDSEIIDTVQRGLDGEAIPGTGKNPTPRQIAENVDGHARARSDHAGIMYGNWGIGGRRTPEEDAKREQNLQSERLRAQHLRDFAERIRGVRRKPVKKAAPAKVAPEVQVAEAKADDLQKRLIDNALVDLEKAKTRKQGNDALEGLTLPELRRIATSMGERGRSKQELRDKILDRFVPETPTPEAEARLEGQQKQAMDRLRRQSGIPAGPSVTLDQMTDLPSREAAHEVVGKMTKKDLLQWARELSIPGAGSKNMTQLRQEIVEATTGRRLDSIATRGFTGLRPGLGDVGGRPDEPSPTPAPAAPRPMPLSRRASGAGIQTPGRMFSDVDSAVGEADRRLQRGDSHTEVAKFLRERAARVAKADINEEGRRFPVELDKDSLLSIRKSSADYLRRVATHVQQEGKATKATPAKKAAPAKAAPSPSRTGTSPVGGTKSTKPLIENTWGGVPGEVHFHNDGIIGQELGQMGDDRSLDVDGEPLANVVGKLATDAVMGRISQDQLIRRLKALAERLPEGSAGRRRVESMAKQLDAPERAPLDLPDGTPGPVTNLMQKLSEIPLARGTDNLRQRRDTNEMDTLRDLAAQAQERYPGNEMRQANWLSDQVRQKILNQRHESEEGKFQIDRAVRAAMEELDRLVAQLREGPSTPPAAKKATPRLTAIPGGGSGGGAKKRPKLTVVRNENGEFSFIWGEGEGDDDHVRLQQRQQQPSNDYAGSTV